MNLHLLAEPGDSLLLQHTLDHLLRWLYPSLRVFHVSERASPLRTPTRTCPVAGTGRLGAVLRIFSTPFPLNHPSSVFVSLVKMFSVTASGYPSLAITFFLHEAYGEERILKVLDYFQHPPWHFHHTESCGGIPLASAALLRPYLLPSRDFYSLGAGMPVWGVRPVHCGGEILRVTLYSAYDNYEDAVRFYETVLQRQAEEQKTGFCWFTLSCGTCARLVHAGRAFRRSVGGFHAFAPARQSPACACSWP